MNTSDIIEGPFRHAVSAIDNGDITALKELIDTHPLLLTDRLICGGHGYFKDPFLLYFIAGNPIRNDKLPDNIVAITKLILGELKETNPDTLQEQLTFTLGLVSTGYTVKESKFQIELMDLLLDAGAEPGDGLSALAHGNREAAEHLLIRGGPVSLPAAVALGHYDDVDKLLEAARSEDKTTALTVAAFYAMPGMLTQLLNAGTDPNNFPPAEGFHSHATALHHAVASGSIECVKLLVNAGADLHLADHVYQGTALDWAKHLKGERGETESKKSGYAAIEKYLESVLS